MLISTGVLTEPLHVRRFSALN